MNNTTNVWAAVTGYAAASETVQRMAFTFGYSWSGARQVVMNTTAAALLFNPDNKTIEYALLRDTVEEKACKVCVTYDQVLETLKNPPKVVRMEKVGAVEIWDDGSLLVDKQYPISADTFRLIVEARNKLMGKKVKMPIIRFSYDSPTSGKKVRKIALLREDKDYLEGLDFDDGMGYKQFRKDRIPIGTSILFLGLTDE